MVIGPWAFGQQNDFGAWTGLAAQLKLGERFEITMEEQARFRNNAQSIEQTFTELGLGFKLTKRIDFGFNYRNAIKENATRHRFNIDAALQTKFNKKWSMVNRFRYQVQYRYDGSALPKFRHKIGLDYKLNKKVKANLDAELFYSNYYDFKAFSANRFKSALNFRLTDWLRLDVFGLYQSQINDEFPISEFIVGTGLKFYLN